jgi:hypothetical protein
LSVAQEIRGNGGRPSGKRPALTPDLKRTTRKKRRRDPHTARHAASRPERRSLQRQQRRDPGLRLGRLSPRQAARGGAACVALDRSASVARWPASGPGRAPARHFPAEHHADHQGGALARDRKFRGRIPAGCRSSRTDRRATAASRADRSRPRTTQRPGSRAGGRPDAQCRQAKPRSHRGARTTRDSGGRPVRRHAARPDHRDSGATITVSIRARQAE